MKVPLPCSTEHWEADSAAAWASLRPWARAAAPPNISFRETMDRLFSGSPPTQAVDAHNSAIPMASTIVVDEFHRILISTTLLRMVWDHRESMRGPGPLYTTNDAAPADKTRVLLSLLEALTTSSLQPAARRAYSRDHDSTGSLSALTSARLSHAEREFQGLVHRARVSLVAQIVAADDISDHLDARWSRHREDPKHNARKVAERSLRKWAKADLIRPRRMARVGAQLLAISRLYPYNLPREPYDAFRAGLLLWTMLPLVRSTGTEPGTQLTSEISHDDGRDVRTSMPSALHADASPISVANRADQGGLRGLSRRQRGQRVCQLDWLGPDNSDEAQSIRDWIQQGGDEFVLRIHGIADICTQQGSHQILQHTADLLSKLQVWGSSHMYREFILRALCDAEGD